MEPTSRADRGEDLGLSVESFVTCTFHSLSLNVCKAQNQSSAGLDASLLPMQAKILALLGISVLLDPHCAPEGEG